MAIFDNNKLKAENIKKAADDAKRERDRIAAKAANFVAIKECLRAFAQTAEEVYLPIDWFYLRRKLGLRKGWHIIGNHLFVTKRGKFYKDVYQNGSSKGERVSLNKATEIFQDYYYDGYSSHVREDFNILLSGGYLRPPPDQWR
ncbi:MAG: hypothetical protein LBN30_04260 [Oscillospiraceae bacterium]|jgi:hypothetical protein|nr:hypothetical protein [Oscillospiraceae bacterium]